MRISNNFMYTCKQQGFPRVALQYFSQNVFDHGINKLRCWWQRDNFAALLYLFWEALKQLNKVIKQLHDCCRHYSQLPTSQIYSQCNGIGNFHNQCFVRVALQVQLLSPKILLDIARTGEGVIEMISKHQHYCLVEC